MYQASPLPLWFFLFGVRYHVRTRAHTIENYAAKLGMPLQQRVCEIFIWIVYASYFALLVGIVGALVVVKPEVASSMNTALLIGGVFIDDGAIIHIRKTMKRYRHFLNLAGTSAIAFLLGVTAEYSVLIFFIALFLFVSTPAISATYLLVSACVLLLFAYATARGASATVLLSAIAGGMGVFVVAVTAWSEPLVRDALRQALLFVTISSGIRARDVFAWLGVLVISVSVIVSVRRARLLLLPRTQWRIISVDYALFYSVFFCENIAWHRWPDMLHWPLVICMTVMLASFFIQIRAITGLSPEAMSYGVFVLRLRPDSVRVLLAYYMALCFLVFSPIYCAALCVFALHGAGVMMYVLFVVVAIGSVVIDAVVVLHYWKVVSVSEQERLFQKTRGGLVHIVIFGLFLGLIYFDKVGGRLLSVLLPTSVAVLGLCALALGIVAIAFLGLSGYERFLDEVREDA